MLVRGRDHNRAPTCSFDTLRMHVDIIRHIHVRDDRAWLYTHPQHPDAREIHPHAWVGFRPGITPACLMGVPRIYGGAKIHSRIPETDAHNYDILGFTGAMTRPQLRHCASGGYDAPPHTIMYIGSGDVYALVDTCGHVPCRRVHVTGRCFQETMPFAVYAMPVRSRGRARVCRRARVCVWDPITGDTTCAIVRDARALHGAECTFKYVSVDYADTTLQFGKHYIEVDNSVYWRTEHVQQLVWWPDAVPPLYT